MPCRRAYQPGRLQDKKTVLLKNMKKIFAVKTIGGCMRPLINNGKFIFIEKISFTELRRGDLVLYESNGRKFLHRIWKLINNNSLFIGDDAGIIEAHSIQANQVMGRAISHINGVCGLVYGKFLHFVFKTGRYLKI